MGFRSDLRLFARLRATAIGRDLIAAYARGRGGWLGRLLLWLDR